MWHSITALEKKKSRQSEEFGLEVQKCEINQQLVNKSELNNEH